MKLFTDEHTAAMAEGFIAFGAQPADAHAAVQAVDTVVGKHLAEMETDMLALGLNPLALGLAVVLLAQTIFDIGEDMMEEVRQRAAAASGATVQ